MQIQYEIYNHPNNLVIQFNSLFCYYITKKLEYCNKMEFSVYKESHVSETVGKRLNLKINELLV
jgi:hypothetical protein